LIVKDDMMSK